MNNPRLAIFATATVLVGASICPLKADPAPTTTIAAPSTALTTGTAAAAPSAAPTPVPPKPKLPAAHVRVAAHALPAAPVIPPWDQFPLDAHTRVKLEFRNASVDAVLHLLIQASGIPIIKDPAVNSPITVESSRPLSLDDAFALVNADLALHNYEIDKGGKWLVVRAIPAPPAPPPAAPARPMPQPSVAMPPPAAPDDTEPILVTYKIKYASATELARVINEAFTALAPPQQNPFQPPQPAQTLGDKHIAVRASAEDYSNTLLVNAPKKQQAQIAALIATTDITSESPHKSQVFHLIYARASDVEPVVENILDASTPLGRGGSTSSQNKGRNNNPFVFFFGQQQQNQNPNGDVIANDRTNSLIVTSTDEILEQVTDVVADLDKPAVYQSTTFVYTLKNARADVVSNLLNQSFGNHESSGPVGGSLTGTGPRQTLASAATSSNGNSGGVNNQPPGFNNNTNNGNNQQNNGNNQQNNGSQNGGNNNPLPNLGNETSSLDDQGHVVNVKNLIGAVLLVPNIDTNSIICVCEPEDRSVLEEILAQMDEVPEQVMIQTLVVEVTLDKTDAFGFEFGIGNQLAGLLGSATNQTTGAVTPTGGTAAGSGGTVNFGAFNTSGPAGLQYTLTSGQYQAVLQAINSSTKYDVLSTPRIFTTNNATAEINISESLPYITSTTEDATIGITTNYSFLNVGIVLTVTPLITSSGNVTMDVTQTANDLEGYTTYNAPIVNQREAEATVSVKDGETVVLGGIISDTLNDTQNKIPLLGDIPLLGNLFKSVNKTKSKTELLVFMTPHIVRNADDARRLKEQAESEIGKDTRDLIPKAPPIAGTSPGPASSAPPAGGSVTVSPSGQVTTTAPIVIPLPSVTVAPGAGGTVIVQPATPAAAP